MIARTKTGIKSTAKSADSGGKLYTFRVLALRPGRKAALTSLLSYLRKRDQESEVVSTSESPTWEASTANACNRQAVEKTTC
jgi:hypothetical protein